MADAVKLESQPHDNPKLPRENRDARRRLRIERKIHELEDDMQASVFQVLIFVVGKGEEKSLMRHHFYPVAK